MLGESRQYNMQAGLTYRDIAVGSQAGGQAQQGGGEEECYQGGSGLASRGTVLGT